MGWEDERAAGPEPESECRGLHPGSRVISCALHQELRLSSSLPVAISHEFDRSRQVIFLTSSGSVRVWEIANGSCRVAQNAGQSIRLGPVAAQDIGVTCTSRVSTESHAGSIYPH